MKAVLCCSQRDSGRKWRRPNDKLEGIAPDYAGLEGMPPNQLLTARAHHGAAEAVPAAANHAAAAAAVAEAAAAEAVPQPLSSLGDCSAPAAAAAAAAAAAPPPLDAAAPPPVNAARIHQMRLLRRRRQRRRRRLLRQLRRLLSRVQVGQERRERQRYGYIYIDADALARLIKMGYALANHGQRGRGAGPATLWRLFGRAGWGGPRPWLSESAPPPLLALLSAIN